MNICPAVGKAASADRLMPSRGLVPLSAAGSGKGGAWVAANSEVIPSPSRLSRQKPVKSGKRPVHPAVPSAAHFPSQVLKSALDNQTLHM